MSSVKISLAQLLGQMPILDRAQWNQCNLLQKWLIASRASVLVMTLVSALIAGLLAGLQQQIDFVAFVSCSIALMLAHACNNLLNDYVDFGRGLDQGNYFRAKYGTHVLNTQLMTKSELRAYIGVTGGAALLIGLYVVSISPMLVLFPFFCGAFFLLFYTYPLKKMGLGEVAVLLVWGPLMVGGSYLVITQTWSWQVAMIGLVYGLGPSCVIFGKHIDKIVFDREKAVYTLPVRLGEARSRVMVVVMAVSMFLATSLLVAVQWLPLGCLIVLLAVPQLFQLLKLCSEPLPQSKPENYPEHIWPLWFSASAFLLTRRFGLLFVIGLILSFMPY